MPNFHRIINTEDGSRTQLDYQNETIIRLYRRLAELHEDEDPRKSRMLNKDLTKETILLHSLKRDIKLDDSYSHIVQAIGVALNITDEIIFNFDLKYDEYKHLKRDMEYWKFIKNALLFLKTNRNPNATYAFLFNECNAIQHQAIDLIMKQIERQPEDNRARKRYRDWKASFGPDKESGLDTNKFNR